MSEDASYELQVAIVAALKNNSAVKAMVKGRVYDRVPIQKNGEVDTDFPYVSLGPEQEISEDYDCIDASEIIIQIDAWSIKPGFPEVKKLAKAIRKALDEESLTLDDNALVYFAFDGRRILRDPDGLTSHAVLTFRAGVEHH